MIPWCSNTECDASDGGICIAGHNGNNCKIRSNQNNQNNSDAQDINKVKGK